MLGRVNIPLIPNYDIGHNFFLNQIVKNLMNVCLLSNYNSKNDQFIYNLENKLSQIINI